MHRSTRTLGLAASIGLALAAAPALYAAGSHDPEKPAMGMGGMMNMMRGKGGMMEGCRMMMGGQATPKPNEQWREKPPAASKKDG